MSDLVSQYRGWDIVLMNGYRITHPYLARDPNCPKERHPTRNCRCQPFRTVREAKRYIDSKEEGHETPSPLRAVGRG